MLLKDVFSKVSPLSSKELILRNLNVYIASLVGISSAYIYQSIEDDKRYNRLHESLFSKYIKKDANILEIGFGNSYGANLDYYKSDNRIVGIDPAIDINDTTKINNIKRKYSDRNISLQLMKGSAENINYASDSFDVIVSTLVFCTIDDPIKALRECSRVLKKGGLLLCIDHILSDDDSFLAYQQKLLSPLQEIVADGCHLNRRTDLLFEQFTRSNNDNNDILFDKMLSLEYFTINSQWPICRQISAVLQK
jgi:SAM-dependent methyltransferase